MTTNIAKIRAALELLEWRVMEAERKNQTIVATRRQLDEALAALAELEESAAPQFVAGELSDSVARKLWREWFDASGITGVESAHFWLKALRRELGPALGMVTREEWRPIESAPKSVADGKRVGGIYLLGYEPDDAMVDKSAMIDIIWWEPLLRNKDGTRGKWHRSANGESVEVSPTHWMPLPEPPK